jgi:hypothetical protein
VTRQAHGWQALVLPLATHRKPAKITNLSLCSNTQTKRGQIQVYAHTLRQSGQAKNVLQIFQFFNSVISFGEFFINQQVEQVSRRTL